MCLIVGKVGTTTRPPEEHFARPTSPSPRLYESPVTLEVLPFFCDFGTPQDLNMCGIKQDETDILDWFPHSGGTYTSGTGPPSEGFQRHGTLSH